MEEVRTTRLTKKTIKELYYGGGAGLYFLILVGKVRPGGCRKSIDTKEFIVCVWAKKLL